MGFQISFIVGGLALMIHAGIVLEGARKDGASRDAVDALIYSPTIFLEVLLGAILMLWGSVGDFKPIRVADARKPRWESMYNRPDFHVFQNRAGFLGQLLTSEPNNIPEPPEMR